MNRASIKPLLVGAALIVLSALVGDTTTNAQDANSILNASLGSVGQAVVVTVSSLGTKDQEYHAHIPNDKYSPPGDNTALSLVEVTKRVNEAIEVAKKQKKSTTITIKIETRIPRK